VARVAGVRVGVGGAREAEQPGGEAAQVVEEEEDEGAGGADGEWRCECGRRGGEGGGGGGAADGVGERGGCRRWLAAREGRKKI
jgi:hypothetical protein